MVEHRPFKAVAVGSNPTTLNLAIGGMRKLRKKVNELYSGYKVSKNVIAKQEEVSKDFIM